MSELTITTNNHDYALECWYSLPKKYQDWFDYIEGDERYSNRFVKYRGEWIDALDTQRITVEPNPRMGWDFWVNKDHPFAKWDSIISDSYFSGVLFKFNSDSDTVRCATYTS